jgi:integrase
MDVKAAVAAMLAAGVSPAALRAEVAAAGRSPGRALTTAAQVRHAGPGKHRIGGAPGLYLRKTGDELGGGAWVWRFWLNGRRHETGLGSLADLALADARIKVAELRVERNRGVNPIEVKRSGKAEAIAEAAKPTFRKLAEDYARAHVSAWKRADAARKWLAPVARYAFPILGDMTADAVLVEHVVAVRKAADLVGFPDAGRRAAQRVKTVLDRAIALGQRDAARCNPADGALLRAAHSAKPRAVEHHRRIALADAPAAFRKLRALAAADSAFAAWCLTILCATRASETLLATWDEFDLEQALWTIPGERMKSGKQFAIPLPSAALEILRLQAARRTNGFVFPGRDGPAPLAYITFFRAPLQKGLNVGTPHSWRSIFRDAAEDVLGFRRETIEAALAHSLGAVEKAYRRETGVPARAVVMQKFAGWLLGESADVVAFPGRGTG